MESARRIPISVGDHPAEDAFVPLHTPKQAIRTNAALAKMAEANRAEAYRLGAGNADTFAEIPPPYMMNTGKPREAPKLARNGGLKIYIAGPMTGIKNFNFPAFDAAAKLLERHGHEVFNPAEQDRKRHGGIDISIGNETGDPAISIAKYGFSLREALRDDTHWICMEANAIAMLPGWKASKGACAEHELAYALGHQMIYLGGFYA